MIDQLINQLGEFFASIEDHRGENYTYELYDCLKGAFAMFLLKDPSLLVFQENFAQRGENLKRVFGLEQIPGDTAFRQALMRYVRRIYILLLIWE